MPFSKMASMTLVMYSLYLTQTANAKETRNTHLGSFTRSPHARLAVFVELNADYIGPAADRAVFDVFLGMTGGWVERDDDLLAAGGTGVGGFGLHTARL